MTDTTDSRACRTSASAGRGALFEGRIGGLLESLRCKYPDAVMVRQHPRVLLQNEAELVPDFDLVVSLPHVRTHYFIECQDRSEYDKSVLHKINHLRAKHWRKTFLFVHSGVLPPEAARELGTEGVIHLTLEGFACWMLNLGITLEAVARFQRDNRDYFNRQERAL